jgi:hypothetical protein
MIVGIENRKVRDGRVRRAKWRIFERHSGVWRRSGGQSGWIDRGDMKKRKKKNDAA